MQRAFGGSDVLELCDVPVPRLEPGSLLVRTTAIGVNFHDIESRRGPEPGIPVPGVPGSDVVGVVEKVGAGVQGFSPGQRVVGVTRGGAYAELTVVPARCAAVVPDRVSDVLAASVPVAGLTAWLLLQDLLTADKSSEDGPSRRAVVAYAAAGGVGCWLGGLLRNTPVSTVGVVSAGKVDVALRAGYDEVVVRGAAPGLVAGVQRATRWRGGADLVLDPVAGPDFAQSFELLRPGGTVVLFGRAGGPPAVDGLAAAFLDARRDTALRTFFLTRALLTRMAAVPAALAFLLEGLDRGDVRMPVTEFPLADAAKAQDLISSGVTTGKLVLRP